MNHQEPENNGTLPTYEGCIICGRQEINASTLGIKFRKTDTGVEAHFSPRFAHQGYKGITHGGMITAVLDETIGWAVAVFRKRFFVTGELTVRFLKYLPIDRCYTVRGWPIEHKSRFSIAEGEITDEAGTVYARATGKFILMSPQQAQEVDAYLTYQENDLHLLDQQEQRP